MFLRFLSNVSDQVQYDSVDWGANYMAGPFNNYQGHIYRGY